ncbi:MAG: tRNA threonylcarbamoyladenosine dehydratase [Clostridia bacterium]|nr:tRNA threonylcarbamoyladenosine dehydratase [Clostridia bacterium]
MSNETFSRTEQLLGADAMQRLSAARVAVFGIGGVGGYVAEALARSGVGALDLFDNDTVCESNLNRQIIALHSTVGQYKVDAMRARIADISPLVKVEAHRCFYMPDNADDYPFDCYDYVVDAVDTVTAKLTIIERAKAAGVPIISCMGTGNKLDPSQLKIADISKTSVCPLARVMRRELRSRGISHLKVVYSTEQPIKSDNTDRTPASVAFVPASAGLMIAGEVVRTICKIEKS